MKILFNVLGCIFAFFALWAIMCLFTHGACVGAMEQMCSWMCNNIGK